MAVEPERVGHLVPCGSHGEVVSIALRSGYAGRSRSSVGELAVMSPLGQIAELARADVQHVAVVVQFLLEVVLDHDHLAGLFDLRDLAVGDETVEAEVASAIEPTSGLGIPRLELIERELGQWNRSMSWA